MSKKNVYGKSRKGTNKKSSRKHSNTRSSEKYRQTSNQMPSQKNNNRTTAKPLTLPDIPTCIIMEGASQIKAVHEVQEGHPEFMFGALIPRPSEIMADHNLLTLQLMTPAMRLELLSLLDASEATITETVRVITTPSTAGSVSDINVSPALLDRTSQKLVHTVRQICCEIEANQAQYDTKGIPTEEELENAYEEWQYQKRKELGEPVAFRDGQLCFSKSIFEAGYQPGPFPGLDLYTLDNKLVAPHEFGKWLRDTQALREKGEDEWVGIFGCPACKLRMADMVWFYGLQFGIHGSNNYRATIKFKGGLPRFLATNSSLVQTVLESGKPLPCMARD